MSQKNKIVPSLSLVANFCPAHPLLPKSRSWPLLWVLSPLWAVSTVPSLLLNWRLFFFFFFLQQAPLPAPRRPAGGRAGQALLLGLWTLSCPFIIRERMDCVFFFVSLSLYVFCLFVCLFCSCGTWSQSLKSVPKLTGRGDSSISLFWFLDRFFVHIFIDLT